MIKSQFGVWLSAKTKMLREREADIAQKKAAGLKPEFESVLPRRPVPQSRAAHFWKEHKPRPQDQGLIVICR